MLESSFPTPTGTPRPAVMSVGVVTHCVAYIQVALRNIRAGKKQKYVAASELYG